MTSREEVLEVLKRDLKISVRVDRPAYAADDAPHEITIEVELAGEVIGRDSAALPAPAGWGRG